MCFCPFLLQWWMFLLNLAKVSHICITYVQVIPISLKLELQTALNAGLETAEGFFSTLVLGNREEY